MYFDILVFVWNKNAALRIFDTNTKTVSICKRANASSKGWLCSQNSSYNHQNCHMVLQKNTATHCYCSASSFYHHSHMQSFTEDTRLNIKSDKKIWWSIYSWKYVHIYICKMYIFQQKKPKTTTASKNTLFVLKHMFPILFSSIF